MEVRERRIRKVQEEKRRGKWRQDSSSETEQKKESVKGIEGGGREKSTTSRAKGKGGGDGPLGGIGTIAR